MIEIHIRIRFMNLPCVKAISYEDIDSNHINSQSVLKANSVVQQEAGISYLTSQCLQSYNNHIRYLKTCYKPK